jgi:hypothetical protein
MKLLNGYVAPGISIKIRKILGLSQYDIEALANIKRHRLQLFESGNMSLDDEEMDRLRIAFKKRRNQLIAELE